MIIEFLKFEGEESGMFGDGRLPTLDTSVTPPTDVSDTVCEDDHKRKPAPVFLKKMKDGMKFKIKDGKVKRRKKDISTRLPISHPKFKQEAVVDG